MVLLDRAGEEVGRVEGRVAARPRRQRHLPGDAQDAHRRAAALLGVLGGQASGGHRGRPVGTGGDVNPGLKELVDFQRFVKRWRQPIRSVRKGISSSISESDYYLIVTASHSQGSRRSYPPPKQSYLASASRISRLMSLSISRVNMSSASRSYSASMKMTSRTPLRRVSQCSLACED